ncbi:MAG TPA: lipopolysaccharide transport periplasmic protein LptA [Burkholderiales bacterium]|nr:lipopolysaccharide transport periplasmic protein LptA [Burkholderiales bacterium]
MKHLLCILLLALLPLGAQAEKADREKAINVESDRVTVDDVKQFSVFDGNVVLTQGTMVIRGDRMEMRQDKEGFKQGTVWGKRAYFRQKREGSSELIEGWAERVEYDSRADKVQLFTRAAMKRGEDDVSGDYISYDATTEFFQVIGGGSKAGNDNNPEGRVITTIQPKVKPKPPAQLSVPLKSADGISAPRDDPRAPK